MTATMTVSQALAILISTAAEATSPERGGKQAFLGVTATVIRPAEIVVSPLRREGAVALIHNSAAIEVVADGGTVRQLDGETTAVTINRGGLVTLTLVF